MADDIGVGSRKVKVVFKKGKNKNFHAWKSSLELWRPLEKK